MFIFRAILNFFIVKCPFKTKNVYNIPYFSNFNLFLHKAIFNFSARREPNGVGIIIDRFQSVHSNLFPRF